jgi:hypothetical protein
MLGNGGRKVIKFVAVGAGEITAPHGDNMGEERVPFPGESPSDEEKLSNPSRGLNMSWNYDAPS